MVLAKVSLSAVFVFLLTFVLAYVVLAPHYAALSSLSKSRPVSEEPEPAHEDDHLEEDHDEDHDDTPCDAALLPISPDAPLNITIPDASIPILPSRPAPHALSDAQQIIPLFLNLSRATTWTSIANITLQADTFEPEGLLRLGTDRYLLSCGEYTLPTQKFPPSDPIQNGTDRTPGAGYAHLMMFDAEGTLLANASISRRGTLEYHNGGIDWDGERVWGVLGQYRPNTSATVYTADADTLEAKSVLWHGDHLGAVAVEPVAGHKRRRHGGRRITSLNWGGRTASIFQLPEADDNDDDDDVCIIARRPRRVTTNPSHFVDYQDCKYLGPWGASQTLMLCSGVASLDDRYSLGGLALVDIDTMQPVAEVPVALRSEAGVRMTQNPVDVSVHDGRLRFYWVPDQHNSTLYIYEAEA